MLKTESTPGHAQTPLLTPTGLDIQLILNHSLFNLNLHEPHPLQSDPLPITAQTTNALLLRKVNAHRLGLCVVRQRRLAELAADAGLLVAAEWLLVVEHVAAHVSIDYPIYTAGLRGNKRQGRETY